IEYSISINLLSTITLWFVFFAFQALAPERERLHLISLIFFNNLYDLGRWTAVYPILTIISLTIFALAIVVEFQALQLFQTLLQIFSEQDTDAENEAMPLINRINLTLIQIDSNTLATVFQANLLSHFVIVLLIVAIDTYGGA
ncbi:MAG: hypothetical protein AAGA60_17835, partial [Cyanobacteria bacterium P01_E01_bin.42]